MATATKDKEDGIGEAIGGPPIALPGSAPLEEARTTPLTIMVRENGHWVERQVMSAEEREKAYADIPDESDQMHGALSDAWHNGRGSTMAYKWLNANPKWHGRARQMGWEPVNPKDYSDHRYPVRDLPGIGKCITNGNDLILCEMPKEYRSRLRALKEDRIVKVKIARMFGLGLDTSQYNGLIKDGVRVTKQIWGVEDLKALSALKPDSAIAKQASSFIQATEYLHKQRARARQMRDFSTEESIDYQSG